MAIGTCLSIITLNVSGLNASTKRHRLAEWVQKQDPYICCLQETHFRPKDTYRLKVKGWKKIFHVNGNQKKAEWQSLFQTKKTLKNIIRDREGHYIKIKGSIHKEDITTVNIYAPIGVLQYLRQAVTGIRGEMDSNRVTAGHFNTPLIPMDRSSKQ